MTFKLSRKLRLNHIVFGGAVALAIVLAPFQNCSKKAGSDGGNQQSSASTNNGQGYDGKTFYHLYQNGICLDGGVADSEVRFRGGLAYLVRDNCMDIPPSLQTSVQSQVHFLTNYTLLYSGRLYFAWFDSIWSWSLAEGGEIVVAGEGFKIHGNGFSEWINNPYIAKYDSQGKAAWIKGHPWFPTSVPEFNSLPDGSFFVLAGTNIASAGFDGVWLSHLNSDGNMLWNKSVTMAPETAANYSFLSIRQIVPAPQGGFLAIGYLRNNLMVVQTVLLSLDSAGQLKSSRVLETSDSNNGKLLQSPQGDIFLSVNLGGHPMLAKISPQGDILWNDVFPELNSAVITFSSSGGLLITGTILGPVPSVPSITLPSYRFIALNSDGSVKSTHQWFEDYTMLPAPLLISSGDGGYIAQIQALQGNGVSYVKFDSDFNMSWAINYPAPEATKILRTRLANDGTFVQELKGNSFILISPQSSTTFPSSLLLTTSISANCRDCTTRSVPAVSVSPNVHVTIGPGFSFAPGILVRDVTPPAFTDLLSIFLN